MGLHLTYNNIVQQQNQHWNDVTELLDANNQGRGEEIQIGGCKGKTFHADGVLMKYLHAMH